jgi:tight adherence protein B
MYLIAGVALLLIAVFLLLAFTFGSGPSLPVERRRPYQPEGTSQLTRFAGSAVDALERFLAARNLKLYNRESLELAGLKLSQADYLVLVFAGACVAALAGTIVAGPLLAIPLFLAVPVAGQMVLKFLIGKRRAQFDEQLTDTIQLLTGSLRAGHSILRAIDATAAEAASPTAEEMRRVVTETSLGKDLLASLNAIADRMNNEDFIWIAQAIQINREVGGNLAEVLDQVNATIRERAEIKGQIKALAAEGKFSAYILLALPFGLVMVMMVMSPGYMDPLLTEPLGWVLMGVSAVLMTIGTLWLRKIVDLKF